MQYPIYGTVELARQTGGMQHNTKRKLLAYFVLLAMILTQFSPAATQSHHSGTVPPTNLYDYEYWFGNQHSHINQDGDDGATGSTAEQAFAYAKNLPHLQYFAVTPHLHASRSGSATLWYESTYDAIRASAVAATTDDFVALVGVEVGTISKGGHWNLYNAQDLVGQDHPDGDWDDTDDYYEHTIGLAAAGETIAVQYNHPNNTDFGNRYDPNAASYVGALAVSSGNAFSTVEDFSDSGSNYESEWAHFLNLGWKLAPSADQDNHNATWGASSTEYTVIFQPGGTLLNPTNVVRGIQSHSSYATEDPNMHIGFTANGWSMGQTISGSTDVAFVIWWDNPSETLYNLNNAITNTEPGNDVIQNIWIYQNGFSSAVAITTPNTIAGTWQVTVTATAGDWFVVKFQDTQSLATKRSTTKDYTWSAPVWYDPTHADVPLTVPMTRTVTLSAITAGQWYDLKPLCGQVYFTETGTTHNVTVTMAYTYPTASYTGLPRHYHIEGDGDGIAAQLALCYSHAELTAAHIPLSSETQLHLYHNPGAGSEWTAHSTVDATRDRITAANVTAWGVWGIGLPTNAPTANRLHTLRAYSNAYLPSIIGLLLIIIVNSSDHRRGARNNKRNDNANHHHRQRSA